MLRHKEKNIALKKPYCLVAVLFILAIFCADASACPDIDGLVDFNCDQVLRIVAFGDSITYGRGDDAGFGGFPGRLRLMYPHASIINLGLPGERTANGKSRAAKLLPAYTDADYVLVLEGVNDYFETGHSSSATKSNLGSITSSGSRFGARTLLGSLTDVKRDYQRPWVLSVNSAIKAATKINYFSLGKSGIGSDGLHPFSTGYQQMANLAASIITQTGITFRPADADGDGIYDFKESQYGSVVGNPDTDGDGILDGVEIFTYHSNPNSTNSDGDDFSDFDEVFNLHSNPANARPGAPNLTSLQILP